MSLYVLNWCRIEIATIRNLGLAPCPRCTVKKSDVYKLGQKQDIQNRVRNARKDDHHRRHTIKMVAAWINEKGYVIQGTPVQNVLKKDSWVPIEVRPN